MDFESQRKKRMEALDEKRKRLEEMRKGRKERIESAEEVHESQQSAASERAQVDSLVNSLLISTINDPATESSSAADLITPRYACSFEFSSKYQLIETFHTQLQLGTAHPHSLNILPSEM